MSADAARDAMMAEMHAGAAGSDGARDADFSSKTILIRGCDPVMAQRAGAMLPPMLGNVNVVSATDDDHWLALVEDTSKVFDVVAFAPGACRWSAAGRPIPGGNAATKGWSVGQYAAKARAARPSAVVVELPDEADVVPRLRAALGSLTR